MLKRISITTLLAIVLSVAFIVPAYATPPNNPYFTTGTADAAGYYIEYYSSGSWKDLKTPQHWEKNTGDIAYCLDQTMSLPTGSQVYSRFNPSSVYSDATIQGLYSILGYGYPNTTGGLPNDMARNATSNAIRAWLKESAGIGYNFMNLSNGLLRAKDGSPWAFSWMKGLVGLARQGNNPLDWSSRSVTTSPSIVELSVQGDSLVGTFTINCPSSSYTMDTSKLPEGFAISGFSGSSGDTLTISGPTSYSGGTVTIADLFTGMDTLSVSNISWYSCTNNYQPMVCVDFSKLRAVISGSLTIEPNLGGYVKIIKTDDETGYPLQDSEYGLYDSGNNLIAELTTDTDGKATSTLLEEGNYYLVEISAPEGYLVDETHHTVSVPQNGTTISVKLSDTQIKGYVELTKVGEQDDPLENAVYGVYTADNQKVCELTTDENGYAISEQIPYGSYYSKEISAPVLYNLNDEALPFSITEHEATVSLSAEDTLIRGQVQITKTGEYGEPLSGVIYGIFDSGDNLIEEITTDDSGIAVSSLLVYGDYYLKELETLPQFNINKEPILFEIRNQSEVIKCSAVNMLIRGSVKIIKTSAQDNQPIEGAVFWLLSSVEELIEELITDSDGIVVSSTLFYGDYYLQEQSVPDGFVLDDKMIVFSILSDGEVTQEIKNQPDIGSVEVFYRHIDSNHELADTYLFTDWIGEDYMAWLSASGLDEKSINGYTLVKSEYPDESVLVDGKLTVTFWYDDKINGEWSDVYIPKTGQRRPLFNYIASAISFLIAGIMVIKHYVRLRPKA